jgi:GalNAc5-diNAcBac-PP-undecaprenol beta-1,3-glucosyltransferase
VQEEVSLELFVVGDGVGDDTRRVLAPFLDDVRVRFFDRPKGERHGERLRHEALLEASGEIVCYLSDDDLLLPDHVRTMRLLLEAADFAHGPAVYVHHDGSLVFLPFDLARPECVDFLLRGQNSIGLTGAAHTLAAYRRLPVGWRPAPPGVYTDLYMWQQFLGLPGFRGVTGTRLTHLHFPSPPRADWTDDQREAELARSLGALDRGSRAFRGAPADARRCHPPGRCGLPGMGPRRRAARHGADGHADVPAQGEAAA